MNKPIKNTNLEKQRRAIEVLSTDPYLSVNTRLLSAYGPDLSIYISNLVDRFQYFTERKMLTEDGGFFLTYEVQQEQTGMSAHRLRKCKNKLKEMGILTTEIRGIPPKEFYFLNIDKIIDIYKEEK